ncbi:hypothetical protein DPMN_110039 [Dreissena polymorpha]|uniref:Uncharacterized protein n=1 Tax=Dreissena polymorpha TaxID=45954 RepID=A0A9D4QMM2_DREPO|nr:hypothetical protein DPMN_110039 [Dreissena polymorpha]
MAGIVLEPLVAKEPSCPVCSHYDYEERLLERVIRNELALKDTLEKITETNAKVDETLKKIENENSKLNNAIHALEEKKSSLDVKVDAFIVSRAHNVSESVAEMKAAIKSLVVQTTKELGVMKGSAFIVIILRYI